MTCSIEECGKPMFNKTQALCAMHYSRWLRHGDPLQPPHSAERRDHPKCAAGCKCGKHKSGWLAKTVYVVRTDLRTHPLAYKTGLVYEHRAVLYDAIGTGPHPCHWCGVVLSWGGLRGVIADHVNRDKRDNRPENLVPSCQKCNITRVGVAA